MNLDVWFVKRGLCGSVVYGRESLIKGSDILVKMGISINMIEDLKHRRDINTILSHRNCVCFPSMYTCLYPCVWNISPRIDWWIPISILNIYLYQLMCFRLIFIRILGYYLAVPCLSRYIAFHSIIHHWLNEQSSWYCKSFSTVSQQFFIWDLHLAIALVTA